jgi:hypothetical protein
MESAARRPVTLPAYNPPAHKEHTGGSPAACIRLRHSVVFLVGHTPMKSEAPQSEVWAESQHPPRNMCKHITGAIKIQGNPGIPTLRIRVRRCSPSMQRNRDTLSAFLIPCKEAFANVRGMMACTYNRADNHIINCRLQASKHDVLALLISVFHMGNKDSGQQCCWPH